MDDKWTLVDDGDCISVVAEDDDVVYEANRVFFEEEWERVRRQARMIAAAPALLGALENALAIWGMDVTDKCYNETVVKRIRAALALVRDEGQQEAR